MGIQGTQGRLSQAHLGWKDFPEVIGVGIRARSRSDHLHLHLHSRSKLLHVVGSQRNVWGTWGWAGRAAVERVGANVVVVVGLVVVVFFVVVVVVEVGSSAPRGVEGVRFVHP